MKILTILPLMAVLSGCSIMDFKKSETPKQVTLKKVIIEDRGRGNEEVDAVLGEQSSFKWEEEDQSIEGRAVVEPIPKQEIKRLLATLETNNAKFNLHFDFDTDEISKEASQEIFKHAQFMTDNPKVRLRLEGHADERGSREYNLALAENRALRVKEVMSLYKGIEHRVSVVSYGEEQPISDISNESGWQKNRRVEFIYE